MKKYTEGSSWRQVIKAVRKPADLREGNNSRTYITLRVTVGPANVAEMPEFIRFCNSQGCVDRITLGFDKKTMPGWIKKNNEDFLRIYREFLQEAAGFRVLCDTFRPYRLTGIQSPEENRLEFGPKGQFMIDAL